MKNISTDKCANDEKKNHSVHCSPTERFIALSFAVVVGFFFIYIIKCNRWNESIQGQG